VSDWAILPGSPNRCAWHAEPPLRRRVLAALWSGPARQIRREPWVGCEDDAVPRASLDKQPHEIAAMFDRVAARYDITNDVLSLGQDRRWRRAVEHAVGTRAGERVLDLAAGTGTSSEPFAGAGVFVVPCDFSLGMLRAGKRRRPALPFVAGDALRLPFADASFDAVTISFGLRNLNDIEAGLREMLRVTQHGGRLVVCEFSHPTWAPFRTVYIEYLMRALPPLARRVSSSPDAYAYLAESIRAWPDQRALAGRIAEIGWSDVRWRDLSGGIVALHHATRPRN
jgi:demethylmenaquinone methyltransferase / 2-methoxy-6-polyprenyl-1,4-benzoquinol methylase